MFKEIRVPEIAETKSSIDSISGYDVKPSFFDKFNNILEQTEKNMEKNVPNVVQNKLDGCRRENEVARELEKHYPPKTGCQILRERVLCSREGTPVIDEKTGSKRRIDFVVIQDGKVINMTEVTSKTAPKRDQLAKEYRIRDNGGNYIKDYNGNIFRIPGNVETRVERRD